jgi:hypothetical protein
MSSLWADLRMVFKNSVVLDLGARGIILKMVKILGIFKYALKVPPQLGNREFLHFKLYIYTHYTPAAIRNLN